MHKPNTAKRRPTLLAAASSVLLASGLALAGCSSEPEANNPAEGPTATATSTATATVAFMGEGCTYDGPSEFDVDSTVTFTVSNESDSSKAGFAVWKVPEGTTPEEIYDNSIFSVVSEDDVYDREVVEAGPGQAYDLAVTFEETGQHGINCFKWDGGRTGSDHVTMFTVNA